MAANIADPTIMNRPNQTTAAVANIDRYLASKGVAPTAIRIMIYRTMAKAGGAVSASGLEQRLDSVPLSTITRTLDQFTSHHITHSFSTDTGAIMYALCPPDCHGKECGPYGSHNAHAHFVCEACGRISCLPSQSVDHINLPDGFTMTSASIVIKGHCNRCNI